MRMLHPIRTSLLLIAVIVLSTVDVEAQKLYSRRTEHLNLIHYDPSHEYLTYHLTRCFENSLEFHRKLFNYTPSEPVVLLMQDFGDYGHGGTSTVPWNYLSIGIAPFDYVYETMPANERMNWLMHHELVHLVATDKAAGADLRFRKLFRGKVAPTSENPISMFYSFLTSPRWYSPRWYHEGIAVFLETWMAGGVGRALGGYDEMVFRTMVLDDAYFYDVVGLESEGTTIDFQVGQNSYLYGTRFVTWLALEHGPEKIIQWFDRSPDSKRYFSSQFRNVYGVSLDEEWRRWIAFEREWQAENLAMIREHPVTVQTPIPTPVLGSVSRSFYDEKQQLIYAAVNRPARPAQIVAIDVNSGKTTPLTEVGAPALYYVTSLAWDQETDKLFFTTDNTRGWRDLNELDLKSGRRRLLLKNARIGDLVVNQEDRSIWGMQHHNGFSTLVRIPPPYDEWKTIVTLDYGRDLFDLDISPDGATLSGTMIDVSGRQQLVSMSIERLLAGDRSFEVLHEFPSNAAANFVFSRDGSALYGTSYYTGVSNVFRYDRGRGEMEALTNAETGLFRPIPMADGRLLAYRYSASGFSPVIVQEEVLTDLNAIRYLGQQVAEKRPVVKEWIAGSPARIDLDEVTTYSGLYHPVRQIGLGSVYPVVEGYRDSVAVGLRFNFADPLGLHALDLTAAISPEENVPSDERIHLKFGYDRSPWKLRLRWNASDFYDLFGPTKTSRKGYSASVARTEFLIYERPKTLDYTLSAAWFGGLDTLPDYQNVRAPFDSYATVNARLGYQNMRRTIGAVDFEKGTGWSVAAAASHVDSDFFSKLYGTFDYGVMLPIDHSSLWLRTSAGKAFGQEDNAFGRFFFGGFGNNWVDHGEIRRYRSFYSFPGTDLNAIGGSDYAKATLEWTLPPLRFRRVGVPGFYTNWARLALFTSGIVTDLERPERRQEVASVGAQVDFSLVLFSTLDSTLSLGYAVARPDGGKSSDEVMISLKLLR
jgi:hypothetical protein